MGLSLEIVIVNLVILCQASAGLLERFSRTQGRLHKQRCRARDQVYVCLARYLYLDTSSEHYAGSSRVSSGFDMNILVGLCDQQHTLQPPKTMHIGQEGRLRGRYQKTANHTRRRTRVPRRGRSKRANAISCWN